MKILRHVMLMFHVYAWLEYLYDTINITRTSFHGSYACFAIVVTITIHCKVRGVVIISFGNVLTKKKLLKAKKIH